MNKRNTLQKGIVFDIFCSMTNHPSAGMVYDEVHKNYPSISRATVYRILAEAAEEGRIKRLKLSDANDRYDITLCKHSHAICRVCGSVSDVETELDDEKSARQASSADGFLIEGCQIEFYGLCKNCVNKTLTENQN